MVGDNVSNQKKVTIIMKSFSRDFLKEHGFMIFKNRELIVESDISAEKEKTMYRFKIGDGVTSYEKLSYVSSLYSIFPNVKLYDKDYTTEIDLKIEGETDVSG